MIDRRPAAIARCASDDDVVAAVDHAREHGLALAVKGGGHSVAGTAVCEGGLMLDLSGMKGVRVDPERRIAVAQPGLTLGELDAATQVHGLATPTGVVSVTGIAGLTLGGGIGWLNGSTTGRPASSAISPTTPSTPCSASSPMPRRRSPASASSR